MQKIGSHSPTRQTPPAGVGEQDVTAKPGSGTPNTGGEPSSALPSESGKFPPSSPSSPITAAQLVHQSRSKLTTYSGTNRSVVDKAQTQPLAAEIKEHLPSTSTLTVPFLRKGDPRRGEFSDPDSNPRRNEQALFFTTKHKGADPSGPRTYSAAFYAALTHTKDDPGVILRVIDPPEGVKEKLGLSYLVESDPDSAIPSERCESRPVGLALHPDVPPSPDSLAVRAVREDIRSEIDRLGLPMPSSEEIAQEIHRSQTPVNDDRSLIEKYRSVLDKNRTASS